MRLEAAFRRNRVDPFLKTLPHSWFISIQQKSIHGSPDKIGCIKGRLVALEIKASDKAPRSALQVKAINDINEAGGYAVFVSPDNWNDVKEYLSLMAGPSLDHAYRP